MKRTLLLSLLLTGAALAGPARAAFLPQATAAPGSAPQGINYQGRLEDNGFPATGTKQMLFRVFDVASGGAALWTSPSQAVSVTIGLFNAVVPVPITALVGGGARYLEVQIDGTLMSPRELLNSVPYALIAKSVEGTIDVSTAGLAVMANSAAVTPALFISSQTGNVGVGTGSPAAAFDVGGSAQFGSGATKSTFTAAGGLLVPGSVGIGTPNPSANTRLHVSDPSHVRLRLDAGAGSESIINLDRAGAFVGQINTKTDNAMWFYAGGDSSNPKLAIANSGNVGIGTTTPFARLDIVGTPIIDADARYAIYARDDSAFAAGVGGGIGFRGKINAGGSYGNFASVKGIKENGTTDDYAGVLAFTTTANGGSPVEKMRISSTGNVGIGTTNPSTALDVEKSVSGTAYVAHLRNLNATNPYTLHIQEPAAAAAGYPLIAITDSTGATERFRVDSGVYTGLRINSSGNVGIGTTSPGAKLDVAGHQLFSVAGASITFNAGGPTIGVPAGNTLAFGTSGIERMRLDNLGNVGIGTTSPAATLHVVGGSILASANPTNVVIYRDTTAADSGRTISSLFQFTNAAGALRNIANFGAVTTAEGVGRAFIGTTANPQGAIAERLVVDNNGNVGIGTTNPGANLHVKPASDSTAVFQVQNAAGANLARVDASNKQLVLGANTAAGQLQFDNGFQTSGFILKNTGATGQSRLQFTKDATDVVTIDNGGNVGIGTTGPNAKLQVAGGDVYASTAGNGFIAKSPDGLTCRRIGIDNTGAIVATAVACP